LREKVMLRGLNSSIPLEGRRAVVVVEVRGGGWASSRYSCGRASISVVQAHMTPSVETLIIMFAPCVPTHDKL
jgi:hypothetical protein